MRAPYLKSTGPTSPTTATSATSGREQLSLLTSCAEDSPARTSQAQAERPVWLASAAGCGLNTPELLASYDPATSSWRTSQTCLLEGLATYSETWPRSGMTRSGTAYRLPTLAHRFNLTGGIASGLWPNPTAGDSVGRGYHGKLHGNYWPALPGAIALSLGYPVQHPITGRVNPTFVEWLMGYEAEWTALDVSEMQSCLSARKSSGER